MNLKATPCSGAHTRLRQIKKLSLHLPSPRGIGRVASAGRVKVFIWRTDGPAKRVTLPSKRLANFLFLL